MGNPVTFGHYFLASLQSISGKRWFKKYIFTFGVLGFPKEASGYVIALPLKYTRYIWKWPYRFIDDVHQSGAKFYLMIDSEEDAMIYSDFPADGIVTDYIKVVGKYFINFNFLFYKHNNISTQCTRFHKSVLKRRLKMSIQKIITVGIIAGLIMGVALFITGAIAAFVVYGPQFTPPDKFEPE